MKKNILLSAVLLIMGFALGCGGGKEKPDIRTRKIDIVATTGMIGDAAKNIGGDRVSVITLMGPGVDPHLYKASEGDVTAMTRADIIFYQGLHLEGKMGEVFEQMSGRIKTVAVAEKIDPSELIEVQKGSHDPHIWFDLLLWKKVVKRIEAVLIELDSAHSEQYKSNTESYLQLLDATHEELKMMASEIPAEKRVLITAHDAFTYFGRRYGFEVKGLQGISTASEAGTKDVQQLVNFIVQRKIPAIFVESSIPVRKIEAVQAAVRSKGFNVAIGGELFSDAMGAPGTPEGTFVGMVKHNMRTITHALKGEGIE